MSSYAPQASPNSAPSGAPQTQAERCRKWMEQNEPRLRPYWDAIDREEAFLDGDRYEINNAPEERDRRLTQIRGQEIQDTIRHFASDATSHPRSVEARPIDSESDADVAEVEVALVDQELRNPIKGFERCYYECVLDSREKRLGIVWMDWEPGYGPWGGEIFYRTIDPRRCLWTEGYDPHHPLCDVFVEKRRCDVDWIHRNYKNSEWVQPDHAAYDSNGRSLREGIPLVKQGAGRLMPSTVEDNKAELWFFWYKNDPEYMSARPKSADLKIPPDQQYIACQNGCGYRSPTQGALAEQGKPQTLPETIDAGCPRCSGTLVKIAQKSPAESEHSYSRGHRLTIIAPFCAAPEDQALYDGKWPIPKARSFPGLFLQAYLKPRRPMGPSDVTLMWDQQVASDNLATIALQRVFEHRDYWILPRTGIFDFNGQRWEARDDQQNLMFRDATAPGPLTVEHLNGTGVDPSWPIVFQAIQGKLVQYRPNADITFGPDQTKNIAASTVAQLVQQQNIPVEEYRRRASQELAKFYGVVSDYIHATYTPQRLTRLNLDGIDLVVSLWGEDMPNFDFVIEETPDFSGLEKARSDAFKELLALIPQAAQLGLPLDKLMEVFAKVNNIPRSIVRDFQKMMAEAQAKAAAAAAPPNAGPPQPAPAGGLDPLVAALMGGNNGTGMPPAPNA